MRKVDDLLAYLARETDTGLAAIAYTTQCLRDAMDTRVAFVATDREALVRQARAWLTAPRTLHAGAERPDEATWRGWLAAGDIERAAAAWQAGADIHWDMLYTGTSRLHAALPLYPFARERYWVRLPARAKRSVQSGACVAGDTSWIEDVLSRVENDELGTDQAVALLSAL